MSTLLEQAVAFVRAGKIDEARPLLIEYLKQNPKDENAWLWMTRCVTEPEQKKYCFEKALSINPQNQHAIGGLAKLTSSKAITDQNISRPQTNSSKNATAKWSITVWILASIVGAAVVLFLCGALLFINRMNLIPLKVSASPTFNPPTALPIVSEACQSSTRRYIDGVAPLLTEFGDTVIVANSTPRISLSPIIQEMQQIRRTISDIPVPNCARNAANLLITSLDEIINSMISFLGDESDSKISRQFDQGVLDMQNANEQLVALAQGKPTPVPQKIPTATPPPPTPMPLPVGSLMTFMDSDGVTWEISVTEVIVADELKSQVSDDLEKAYGRFAIVFMNLTNRGFSPETFVATGQLMIRDSHGNPYGENLMASTYAMWIYETDLAASVNPGETQHIAVVFDISKEGSGYSLMPGPLSNPYQPGLLINIP